MKNQFISALSIIQNTTKSTFLFNNVWKEKSTMLLHGQREADKTAKAVEIAVGLSREGCDVLYVDTQARLNDYADRLAGAEKMLVFLPAYESPDDTTDYADLVIAGIEEAVATTGIRTFVIDSLTRIAALSFGRNASAAYVMKRLVALQVRCGLSMLIIADDTTKSSSRALLALADSELSESDDAPMRTEPVQQVKVTEIEQPIIEKISSPKTHPRYTTPSLMIDRRAPMNRRERRANERRLRKLACRKRH